MKLAQWILPVSSRATTRHFMMHKIIHRVTLKCFVYEELSRAHLAVSTEWVSSPTNECCLWKLISTFTMSHYESLHDSIISTCSTNCHIFWVGTLLMTSWVGTVGSWNILIFPLGVHNFSTTKGNMAACKHGSCTVNIIISNKCTSEC